MAVSSRPFPPLLRATGLAAVLRLLVLAATIRRPDRALTLLDLADPIISGWAGLLYVRWTRSLLRGSRFLGPALAGCLPYLITWLGLAALGLSPESSEPSRVVITLMRTGIAGVLGGLLGRSFGPWEFPYGA